MRLSEPAKLSPPTVAVRESWLDAERTYTTAEGASTALLDRATADFDAIVAERQGVRTMWDVPSTILWYVSGRHYLGELVIRHELTPTLLASGGHVGYSVAHAWRREGHATRMLAAGLVECRRIGLSRIMLTCATDNEASAKVIVANGGVLETTMNGEHHFWIALDVDGAVTPETDVARPA